MQCIELVREQTKAAIGDRREKANGEREGEREKASGEGGREGERGRHLRSKHGDLPLIAMRREDCFAATSSSRPTVLNKATGGQREEATGRRNGEGRALLQALGAFALLPWQWESRKQAQAQSRPRTQEGLSAPVAIRGHPFLGRGAPCAPPHPPTNSFGIANFKIFGADVL